MPENDIPDLAPQDTPTSKLVDPYELKKPVPETSPDRSAHIPAETPTDTPTDIPTPAPTEYSPGKSSGALKFVIIGVVIFLVLFFAATIATAMVAYEKIKLPNAILQNKISMVFQDLPFTPKTPKYVLTKSLYALQTLKSGEINASLAINSDMLMMILEKDTLNITIAGPIDFIDPQNPQAELSIRVDEELDANVIYTGQTGYLKFSSLPQYVFAALGFEELAILENAPLYGMWIFFDAPPTETTSPEVALKKALQSSEDLYTKESAEYWALLDKHIFSKMTKENDTINETDAYVISLSLNADDLHELMTDMYQLQQNNDAYVVPSPDSITSNIEFEVWIAKDTYYIHKSEYSMDLTGDYSAGMTGVLGAHTAFLPNENMPESNVPSGESKTTITLLSEIKRHNVDFTITAPSESISHEKYLEKLTTYYTDTLIDAALEDPALYEKYKEIYGLDGIPGDADGFENTIPSPGGFQDIEPELPKKQVGNQQDAFSGFQ